MPASRMFWTFKMTLTMKFILPFRKDLLVLQFLPPQYFHIDQEQWISFIDEKLSEEW